MPRERQSITHKFSIGGHEGYITAGMYEDGTVGEIFLTDIGKEGSTLRGMMNSFATAISIALQYGVPLETLVQKFAYMRFEPEGITTEPGDPVRQVDARLHHALARVALPGRRHPGGARHPHARRSARAKTAEDGRVVARRRHGRPGATAATAATARRRPRRRRPRPGAAPQPAAAALTDTPPVVPARLIGPRPRPGVQPVRRHDAAHGLVLHVLELRQQHRLRLIDQRRVVDGRRHRLTPVASETAERGVASLTDAA